MSKDEIDKIVSVFVKEGVKKVRLTGGEPLIRKDAKEIIERLAAYPVELAITTNGVYVDEFINTFKLAGIHSVNVSLDSLNRKKNFAITQRDVFDRVLKNIDLLLNNDFHVKVNMVVMKNVNHHEIPDFIRWTSEKPVHVRFIEYMPFDGNQWSKEKVFSHQQMLDLIASGYDFIKMPNARTDTAKKYFVPDHQGTFAIISSMSQPFCSGCNRMRLTSDGKMKNCLFSKGEADILGALRRGENILPLIRKCVGSKEEALGGQFTSAGEIDDSSKIFNRSMINIGG
jgi:cyclic pyranopterin phosphate synthase